MLLQASSPTGHPHLPFEHCSPFWQAFPHAPQFRSSLFSSTHELLQFDRPGAQPAAQAPTLQTAIVLTHVVPHAPQFFGSDPRSTQTPLHGALPAGHPQTPWRQACEAPHFVPHVPQLFGSLCLSTHELPHVVSAAPASPIGHDAAHCPRLQNGVAPVHAVPQAPQFFGSESRFAHVPEHFTSFWRHTTGPASIGGLVSVAASGGVVDVSGPASDPASSDGVTALEPSSPPHAGSASDAPMQPAAMRTAT
jgi:hypothetical protein